MSSDLQINGKVNLEWNNHRFELRGEDDTLIIRSLTGVISLIRLAIWSRFQAPPGLRSFRKKVSTQGLRFKIQLK